MTRALYIVAALYAVSVVIATKLAYDSGDATRRNLGGALAFGLTWPLGALRAEAHEAATLEYARRGGGGGRRIASS